MLKYLFIFIFVFAFQLCIGQKKVESSGLDDLQISNKKISLFRANKSSVQKYSDIVKDSDVFEINTTTLKAIVSDRPERIIMDLFISDLQKELLLHKVNVVSESYQLKTSSGSSKSLPLDLITYRGIVNGTDLKVNLTLANSKAYLIVGTSDGNYEINPNQDHGYVGHYVKDLKRTKNWSCETEDDHRAATSQSATTRSGDCIEVYLECDFTAYTDNGSDVLDTEAWVINMMNSVDMFYDVIDVPLVVSEIFVWDTPDPYQSSTTLTEVRNAFMDQIQNGYNGRIAKLLTTRPIGGGLSNGIGGLCGTYGDFPSPYAISTDLDPNLTAFPSYSYNIYVLAHEIGHVIGARHTHACVWNGNNTQIDDCGNVYANDNGNTPEGLSCFDENNPIIPTSGTVMSNCNLLPATGIDFSNGFHPLVAAELQNNYIDADCSTGTICFTEFPSNDDCLGAIDLTVYDVCNPSLFDNYLASPSNVMPAIRCGDFGPANDVWFRVKVPDSGTITIETTDDGTLDDMIIQVYSGDCTNLTRVECDDNSGTGNHALLDLTGLTPCEYLYIRIVETLGDEEGTFGLCAHDPSVACHPDFDALIDIYNESNGASWSNNSGWIDGVAGTDCDICQWYGVVCDGFGRVKELNLGSNNMTGSLSASIGDLIYLERINLLNNEMTGSIPDVFTELDELSYLDLSNGSFSGSIPDFTGLAELKTIYLEDNNLTGSLPSAVADLPLINIYWVKDNDLSGCIPSNYINLCDIQSVQMQNNESLPSDGDFSQFCESGLGEDLDGDGFCSGIDTDDDCNDQSNTSFPGATEICDGLDNDCNGTIDEGFIATNTWTGGNASWNIDANWSLGHVPLACEDVIVTSGDVDLGTNDAVARSVTVTATGYISITGSLLIQGSDGSSLISEDGSSIDIVGSVEIFSLNDTAVSISGIVNNTGVVTINHPSGMIHMEVISNGNWINQGLGTVTLLTN